ncbi:trypsin-like serine peptidase [Embleya sp. NPDC050154]|uniref:trypsin-like serine peptidase n=1 Tax=unclassified Embleya TaxID=2699296 RepID=UPI0037BC3449
MTRGVRTLFVTLTVAVSLLVTGTVMALTLDGAGNDDGNDRAPGALADPGDPAHWTPERMSRAKPRDPKSDEGPPAPAAAPEEPDPQATGGPLPDVLAEAKPPPVQARPIARPYTGEAGTVAVGKLFFEAPDGPSVCSGTVVADPKRPGRSNLVWTAGHCVHAGRGGTWFASLQFVPAFNSSGQATLANLGNPGPVAPFGQWPATSVATSEQWRAGGTGSTSPATAHDYAVVEVKNPDRGTRSLEEVVGRALPVWFDAPRDLPAASAYGYPQDAPFDGLTMFGCTQAPRRVTVDPNAPPLLRIGCTMTAGASGGGWYATAPDGTLRLIGNSALSGAGHTWIAGPYLGQEARRMLEDLGGKR